MTEHPLLTAVARWVDDLVIGEGLCPWAHPVRAAGGLRIVGSAAPDLPGLFADLQAELTALLAQPADAQATTLVVSTDPTLLARFRDYLDALGLLEDALADADLSGVVQVASFHPDYRFGGVRARDASHYTNRAPAPVFHLLREADVTAAVDSHPDPARIPERNIARMQRLGIDALAARLRACHPTKESP